MSAVLATRRCSGQASVREDLEYALLRSRCCLRQSSRVPLPTAHPAPDLSERVYNAQLPGMLAARHGRSVRQSGVCEGLRNGEALAVSDAASGIIWKPSGNGAPIGSVWDPLLQMTGDRVARTVEALGASCCC